MKQLNQSTVRIEHKTFHITPAQFDSKSEAQAFARKRRKDGARARVVKINGRCKVVVASK
jgi:hypothetical protein